MRIERMDIQAYGSFSERTIHIPSDGMVIVVGPNEAGKSTLISFIRSMLYGFAKRSSMDQRYEPQSGGMMAGRIQLIDREGGRWSIERQERASGSYVRIQHAEKDGQLRDCTQLELEQRLLGGINFDMFKRMFAITLDELHELHTLQGDELRSLLYDAGLDAGRAIADSERKLQQEMDKLYKQRGRNQLLHSTVRSLQEAERGKRELVKLENRFTQVEQEWKSGQQRLELLLKERYSVQQELSMLERAIQVSEMWVKLVAVQSELRTLPDLTGWNASWIEAEQVLKQQIDAIERESEGLRSKHAELEMLIEGEVPNVQLLNCASELRRLIRMSDMVQHWRDNLHETDTEHEALELELLRLARLSGADWTSESLVASQSMIGEVDQVNAYQQQLARCDGLVERVKEELRRMEADLQYAESHAEDADLAYDQHMAAGVLGSGYSPEEHSLNKCIRAWDELSQVPQSTVAEPESAEPSVVRKRQPRLTVVVIVSGVLAAMGLGIAQETIGAIVVGTLSILLAAWIWWGNERNEKFAHRSEGVGNSRADTAVRYLETELALVLRVLRQDIPSTQVDQMQMNTDHRHSIGQRARTSRRETERAARVGGVDRALVDRYDAAITATKSWSRERERLLQRKTTAIEASVSQQRRHEAAKAEVMRAIEEQVEHAAAWQAWLATHSLPMLWSPAAVLAHIERAQQAVEWMRRRERIMARAERLSEEYDAYRNACASVIAAAYAALHAAQQSAEGAAAESAAAVQQGAALEPELARLLAQIEREEALDASTRERVRELAATAQELRRCLQRRDSLTAERAALWQQAGAADAAGFQLLRRQAERYSACLTLERELEAACYRGGERAAFAPLAQLLAEHSAAELEQRSEQLREQLVELDRDIRASEQQTGRLRQEEERLRQEAEREQWGQRAAELEAELDQQASRYVVHALAKSVIAAVRTKYEQEKQPYVYQRAGLYLAAMTGGRYTRVLSPLGTQQLAAQCEDGRIVDSTLLSRGTMEQLYLAMRLALADVMSEQTVLPFIWDDIFVNFDPVRLRQTLEVMPELLEKRQVIWTTCHPHMAEAAQVIGDVPIIRL